jgi:glycosyltransferase involved in cell wall biosynthesis
VDGRNSLGIGRADGAGGDRSAALPRISLVIPAFNEAAFLPALLESVDTARSRYVRGAAAVEVIVADNASTDATASLAEAAGTRVVRIARRAIAAARNGGARAARGGVLAFVDADSLIHPETFNAIEETLGAGDVVVGATGARPSRWSIALAVAVGLMTVLARLARMDTGVVFCLRDDWQAVGGYDERLLAAEDVRFLAVLKRHGRATGRRFRRARGACAITSTRKFDKHGDWRFLAGMARAVVFYVLWKPGYDRLVRRYWYEDRA